MRISFYILIISLLSLRSAFAIRNASDDDVKAIRKQFIVVIGIDQKIGEAQEKVDLAVAAEKGPAVIRELERQVKREKDKQSAARTKAIHMTVIAYDLPTNLRGTSVTGWTKGREIQWTPVGREREARQLQDAQGERKWTKQPGWDKAGATYTDGVTYLFPEAFEHGPGYLASLILHEGKHFIQITTAGLGDKMSEAESEAAAYQAEKDNRDYFLDPIKDKALRNERETFLEEENAVVRLEEKGRQGFKGFVRRILPSAGRPDIFESRGQTDESLEDIHRQAQELREQVEQERDERHLIAMQGFAQRLCDAPDGFTQKELDGIGHLSIVAPYRKEIDQLNEKGVDKGFGTCREQHYLKMLRTMIGGRLQLGELRQWAGEYHRERHFEQLDALAVEYCAFHLTTPGEVDRLARLAKEEYSQELSTLQAPPYGESCDQRLYYLMIETLAQGQALSDHFIQSNGNMFWEQEGLRLIFATGASYGLADLAERACRQGGGITKEDFAPFRWYPNRNVNLDRLPAGLNMSGCARELYSDLYFFNTFYAPRRFQINPQWVNLRARQLARKYAPAPEQPSPQDESPAPQPVREVPPEREPSRQPRGGYDYRPAEGARDKIKNFRFPD